MTALGAEPLAGFKAPSATRTCCSSTTSSSSRARPGPRRSSSTPSTRCYEAGAPARADLRPSPARPRGPRGRGCASASRPASSPRSTPPDLATRVAILRKRVRARRHRPCGRRSCSSSIAERVTTNIRALEGALIRVVAYSSLTRRPIDVELATEVLDAIHPRHAGHSTLRSPRSRSRRLPALRPHPRRADLHVSAGPAVAWPRQVAIYLARELTGESLPAIGRHFGGRNHTTVLHACKRVTERLDRRSALPTSSRRARGQDREQLEPTALLTDRLAGSATAATIRARSVTS